MIQYVRNTIAAVYTAVAMAGCCSEFIDKAGPNDFKLDDVAIQSGDYKPCLEIENAILRDHCLVDVALATTSTTPCEYLTKDGCTTVRECIDDVISKQ